jgi:predicted ATPase
MQLYENTSRHNEAIQSALDGLKLLGIRLPEKPGQVAILTELLKAKYFLRGKSIEHLKNNRDLKSPELILAMKILMNLWGPAYLHNQNLLALAILRMVNISTRFGNAPESALAYTFYGFVSCAQLKDFKGGYEFGKLGLWLNEKFDDKKLRSKVYVIFAGCIAHWKDQFSSTLEELRIAHLVGIEANDLIYSGYALDFLSKNQFMMGEPLSSVYSMFKGYVHFGRKIHHITTLHHLLTETREVCQLMGMKEDPAVFMEFTDKVVHEKAMTEFAEKEGVQLPITAHHVYQAEWCYLSGDYQKALDHVEKAKKTIASMLGLAEEARLNIFHSLTLLALAKSDSQNTPKDFSKKVKSNQSILKKWMTNAPDNFKSKYLLVEAESAALDNRFETATKFFQRCKTSGHSK